MTKRDLIIIGIIFALSITIGIAIGRMSSKTETVLTLPDYSKYKVQNDSIKNLYKLSQDTIKILYIRLDSIQKKIVKNHINLNNGIIKIKQFTPSSRKRYLDSVYLADTK